MGNIIIIFKNMDITNSSPRMYDFAYSGRLHRSQLNSDHSYLELPISAPNINDSLVNTEKFKELKKLYEDRLKDMGDLIKTSYNTINKDPVIQAMKADPSSAEFVAARVKEMIEDALHSEKELTINRIQENLSNSKMEHRKLENEINKYQEIIEFNKRQYEHSKKQLDEDQRKNYDINLEYEKEKHRL